MSQYPAPVTFPRERLVAVLARQPGRDGAVSARNLAVVLGLRSGDWARAIQRAVDSLIDQGCPIGADGDTYFLIATEEELEDAIVPLQSRVREAERKIERLTDAYRHGPRQSALFADGAARPRSGPTIRESPDAVRAADEPFRGDRADDARRGG
jgi:hypothetical protein